MWLRAGFVCAAACAAAFAQLNQLNQWAHQVNQGVALEKAGKFDEAIACYRQALQTSEPMADERLAGTLNLLANLTGQLGHVADAEHYYRRAMNIIARVEGKKTRQYALIEGNLASLYIDIGQISKGEKLIRDAVAINIALLGAEDPATGLSRNCLATIYLKERKFDDAERELTAAIDSLRKHPEIDPIHQAITLNNLGALRGYQGRHDQAIRILEESIAIQDRLTTPANPILRPLNNLAVEYATVNRRSEAEATFRRALEAAEKTFGTAHPGYTKVLANYAGFLRQTGRKAEARELERREKSLATEEARTNGIGMTIDVSSFQPRR